MPYKKTLPKLYGNIGFYVQSYALRRENAEVIHASRRNSELLEIKSDAETNLSLTKCPARN